MTLPQQNSPRIKTPYPYLLNLMSNYLENNILSNTVKIKVVAFFLGHPVYIYFQVVCLLSNHQPISITGADPGFSWGGGGGRKILSTLMHITTVKPKVSCGRVPGPQNRPWKLSVFFNSLSCSLSLIFKHSDTKWDNKKPQQNQQTVDQILGGHLFRPL